ncbi:HNH endonuclease signature motif containing protein [Microbacterium sp. ABRD28]|uniref:HNH endonuclease signature motif containing protein n=1 Tax=Microbacterium sp. ABRD28 TaxID=2268461 RepID=UPI000F54F4F5|nr:HNH endonuclease signature motif containing protein [Microbacterium sp. ABRD28]AZC13267.1 HNH endonuclease [Microbacterium sp. ABRD28]
MKSSGAMATTRRLRDAADRVAADLEAACGAALSCSLSEVVAGIGDDELLALLSDAAQVRAAADVITAAAAAEATRRSARELGYDGLAQRTGHRNGTTLVQTITGQTRADVTRAVRTGEDLAPSVPPPAVSGAESAPAVPATPEWLRLLREALTGGVITQAQFRAIRDGLGDPPVERYPDLDPGFLPAAWATAVGMLLEEAGVFPVEELRNAARIARDRLDPVGVTVRFEERFAARSLRTWTDEHGQQHAKIVFDDDGAAWVQVILSAALRPRRGPRFVESPAATAADGGRDERSNGQVQYDTVLAILRTGAAADPAQSFGDRQPGVRILVTADTLTSETDADGVIRVRVVGVGHLEDGGAAIPGGVVDSYLCDAGSVPVIRDSTGRPLDVGREQRLFTRKQRLAIAARHGGCIGEHCTAPSSWTEIHHLTHWSHGGHTDVDDGVPLCRNCHLGLHNRGQWITRERDPDGADAYWLHSPPDPVSGEAAPPTRLRSRSPLRFTAA